MDKLLFPAWLFVLFAICGLIVICVGCYKFRRLFSTGDVAGLVAGVALAALFVGWNVAFAVWTNFYNVKAEQASPTRARSAQGEGR